MSLPSDFNKTTIVSYALLIWIAAVSFSMGMIYKSIIDNDKEHVQIKEFVIQEVGGLRADWERDKKEQDKKIDKIEGKIYK